jgi:hypothetical protein
MKNRTIALVVGMVLLLCSSLPAQITFERWYGGADVDIGMSVAQTTDGGYIIAGYTESFGAGNYDVYLLKTNALGDTTWARTYGGSDDDYGYSVAQTADGGYIIAGRTGGDVYLIKTDTSGYSLWAKTFDGGDSDYGYSVAQTVDGGYIIAGQTGADVYLIKTSTTGDSLWAQSYGSPESDWGMSVAQTSDEGYIVAGWTMPSGVGSSNVYLIRADSLGDSIWARAYGDTMDAGGNSVALTTDGGFVIAGIIMPFFPYYSPDVYLLKTDSLGDTLWTKTFGTGDSWDEGYSVAQTTDGGYIIAGETEVSVTNRDACLIKTDATGNPQWMKTFGGVDFDNAHSVAQTSDSGYIIGGYTWSYGAGLQDVYLIKTDSLGNVGIEEEPDLGHTTKDIRLTAIPNPFTTSTTISFLGVSENQNTRLSELHIYDSSGRLLKSMKLETGTYEFGTDLKPGVYFLKLIVGESTETKKIIKIR